MKHSLQVICVALATMLSHPGLSQQPQGQDRAGGQPNAAEPVARAGQAATVAGAIESIDRETRTITLKDQKGKLINVRADPKMANFAELEKGNKVLVRYSEAMLVSISSSDAAAEAAVDTPTSPTPPNQGQPAVQAAEQTRVAGKVTEVAPDRGRITLQGPKDEEILLRVHDPQAVAGLKKGDAVIAAYVEALAVSVIPEEEAAGPARANQAPIEAPKASEPDANRPQANEPR